ncbi:MAG: nickel pincer cofactor biosynthesis protein LarB [Anaerovibrio sp.]
MTDLREMLLKVKSGELSLEEAEGYLRRKPFEDMGYAKVDTHRRIRSGFPEVIFAQGKADEHLLAIFQRIFADEGEVMATRASERQYELIASRLPEARYDRLARIITCVRSARKKRGCIAVCTAGTADIPVAEEAAQVAEYFGNYVERIYDVGVSGLHRLLSKVEIIQKANCVIAVAGMEGALGSVIAGLVDKPVIAVPTSVGYGANFHGVSALLTMINSCANGIATVNIDNGYGAGYLAAQINRLAVSQE